MRAIAEAVPPNPCSLLTSEVSSLNLAFVSGVLIVSVSCSKISATPPAAVFFALTPVNEDTKANVPAMPAAPAVTIDATFLATSKSPDLLNFSTKSVAYFTTAGASLVNDAGRRFAGMLCRVERAAVGSIFFISSGSDIPYF